VRPYRLRPGGIGHLGPSCPCHMRAKRRLMTRLAAGAYYRPNGGAGDGVRFVTTHCWRVEGDGPATEKLPSGAKVGGFSAPGGTATKIRMLALEGVHVAPPRQRSNSSGFKAAVPRGQLAINAASLLLSPHDYHRGLRGGLPALLTDSPDGPIQPYWNANIVKQGRLTLTIHCQ